LIKYLKYILTIEIEDNQKNLFLLEWQGYN